MSVDADPRVERSRRVIAEATLAEMAERGYGAMTVEGIAKRAGVSKATIYRQWTGKLEIVEASLELIKDQMEFDESAAPRLQLTELVTKLAVFMSDSDDPGAACLPALVSASQHDPAVRDFLHRFSDSRRQVLLDIITDGQRVGDFDPALDAQLTAELLVGPIFYRRLMTAMPFPAVEVVTLVEAVVGPEPS